MAKSGRTVEDSSTNTKALTRSFTSNAKALRVSKTKTGAEHPALATRAFKFCLRTLFGRAGAATCTRLHASQHALRVAPRCCQRDFCGKPGTLPLEVTNTDVREQKGTVVQPLVRPGMDSVIVFRTPRDFGGNFREAMHKNTIDNAGDPPHQFVTAKRSFVFSTVDLAVTSTLPTAEPGSV